MNPNTRADLQLLTAFAWLAGMILLWTLTNVLAAGLIILAAAAICLAWAGCILWWIVRLVFILVPIGLLCLLGLFAAMTGWQRLETFCRNQIKKL